MNALLSNSITDALGWTLLHAVWQGFALVLPTALLVHILRDRSSALRYRVSVVSLLAQVLVSVGTFAWVYKPAMAVSTPAALTTIPTNTEPMPWQLLTPPMPWPVQAQQFLTAHLSEFVLIYLIGVAVFALRLAGGWLYLQRLSRTAVQPVSKQLITVTESLRKAMQIGSVVRLRESARVAVPMVVGVLKPILLVPIGLVANLSVAEVEAVLAHELAHVKRHDYAVNLLQSVVEVLYFFHPALWWLSARVREEREHCCDDLAVKTIGDDGRTLAKALAHVEEFRLTQLALAQQTTPALAMALSSKRQLLLHRVRRVLGVPTRPHVSNGSLAGLTLATLLLLSASVYAVQQPKPKPKPVRKAVTTVTRDNTTFSIVDKKIASVVWEGQKLPASRIAQLQKLYDQVMAGQLNLNDVPQPNRDMLLQIIEANAGDIGMNALREGFAQIKYGDMVASVNDSAGPDSKRITAFDSSRHLLNAPTDSLRSVKGIAWQTTTVTLRDTSATGVISVVTTTRTSNSRREPGSLPDSTYRHLKFYRHPANDTLPQLQAALAKLQRANTQMRALQVQAMENGWQMHVRKVKRTVWEEGEGLKDRKWLIYGNKLRTLKDWLNVLRFRP